MDRGYLRPHSPSRRYGGHPARNSTGLLDLHPSNYESYYGQPRGSRESLGPRSSADRFERDRAPLRPYHRESLPLRRNPDDYEVAPRRLTDPRRAMIVPPQDAHNYRPVIKSALESPPEYRRQRPREDESFYLTPNVSGRDRHHRTLSSSGYGGSTYRDVNRSDSRRDPYDYDRRAKEYQNVPAIRTPRDKDDRDYGYEYTDMKEQAYRDTAPRQRARRESDAGARERPSSIAGVEDVSKRPAGPRAEGPPVTTRGFDKLDRNGSVRQYRYPRESEAGRSSAAEEEPIVRHKSTRENGRAPVAVHQDRGDGYSSNAEDRSYAKHPRPRREDSPEREPPRRAKLEDDSDRPRKHHDRHLSATDDDSRRHNRHRHSRDETHDTRKPEADRKERADEPETESKRGDRGEESDRTHRRREHASEPEREARQRDRGGELEEKPRRRRRDESYDRRPNNRRDDRGREKQESHHHLAEAALGTAAVAAAGGASLYAKHRHEREPDVDGKAKEPKDEGRRRRHYKEANEESDTSSAEPAASEPERKERRRRRKEREERERKDQGLVGGGDERMRDAGVRQTTANVMPMKVPQTERKDDRDTTRERELDDSAVAAPVEPPRRSHRRREGSGDSTGSSGDASNQKRQVRVVSPERETEVKPKGILKQPKQKFPEDPAPVREGVAPLKDAGKKGIPPNARWTKIDRRLVNPEALEVGNERFEERADYVIVLRVLNKEEIEAYAAKTAEIREERHVEAKRARTLAIDDRDHRSDEDERGPPLAIDDHAHNESDILLPGMPGFERREAGVPQPVRMPAHMTASAPNLQDPYADRPDVYAGNSYHRTSLSGNASMTSSINSAQTWPQPNNPYQQGQPLPIGSYPPPPPPPPQSSTGVQYPQIPQPGSQGGVHPPYPPPPTAYQQNNKYAPPPPPPAASASPPQSQMYAQGANPPMEPPPRAPVQSQTAE